MSYTISAETKRRLGLGLAAAPQNRNRRRRRAPRKHYLIIACICMVAGIALTLLTH